VTIRVAGQRCDVSNELPASGMLHRGGNAAAARIFVFDLKYADVQSTAARGQGSADSGRLWPGRNSKGSTLVYDRNNRNV
jgi:hypothetical protein